MRPQSPNVMKRYAIFNNEGKRMNKFPTYADLITACHALELLQKRHPDAGLYVDDINT